MLIVLFGLSGSGKNFVGDILQNHFGFHFWDADDALPLDMQESIKNKQAFTQDMRDRFTRIIIQTIGELQKTHQDLVISQALYKEINRKQIHDVFKEAHFVHIEASLETITARLKQRNSTIDEAYARKISVNFEAPSLPHVKITNNGNQQLVMDQIRPLLTPKLRSRL